MDKKRKVLIGRVVSDRMDKTVVVSVESQRRHPMYRKVLRRSTKLKAHDEGNACQVGDVVKIEGSRPLSRTKHWRVVETVSQEKVVGKVNDSDSDET